MGFHLFGALGRGDFGDLRGGQGCIGGEQYGFDDRFGSQRWWLYGRLNLSLVRTSDLGFSTDELQLGLRRFDRVAHGHTS